MQVRVNGDPMTFSLVEKNVAELLSVLGCVPERVAVEQNGAIVPRALRTTTRVADGDVFEIVTLVGGG